MLFGRKSRRSDFFVRIMRLMKMLMIMDFFKHRNRIDIFAIIRGIKH